MKSSLLLNIILSATLLTSMFLIAATSSIGEYDPWLDTNDDGRVDMRDIGDVSRAFGTLGDPTKNVTIARRANKLAYTVFNQTVDASGYFMTPWISVDGYSKMTISIITNAYANQYALYAVNRNFDTSYAWGFFVDEQSDMQYGLVKTYDVPNEMIQILFGNNDATPRRLFIDVYLIP